MGFNTYPCSPFPPSTADMEKGDVTEQQKALIATIPGKAQKADIAPEFSTETAYNTGDLVYYNGALYEFTADHAAGAWSTDDTQAATIGGELDQLKSGLTNVNAALSVPENAGRNVINATLSDLKSYNTTGTWADNVYTRNDVTFAVNTNASGYITSIVVTGTASDNAYLMVAKNVTYKEVMKMTGCPANGSFDTYQLCAEDVGVATYRDYGSGKNLPVNVELDEIYLVIRSGYEIASGGLTFYPMIRPSYITDNTYVPYIPSVESRIEAVESGVTNVNTQLNNMRLTTFGLASQATKRLKMLDNYGIMLIMTDRGAMIIKGAQNRGVHRISDSSADSLTVTDVDTSSVDITGDTGGGTLVYILSQGEVSISDPI